MKELVRVKFFLPVSQNDPKQLQQDLVANATENALTNLILATDKCLTVANIKDLINPKQLLKEYKTIHLKGARQIGHTTGIVKILDKFKFNKIAYICFKQEQANRFTKLYSYHYYQDSLLTSNAKQFQTITRSIHYFTYGQLKYGVLRGQDFDLVIVDTASFMTPTQTELLYDELSPMSDTLREIVFLQ